MKLALIASLIIAGLSAFFAVQNAQVAKVSFLGWYFEASLVMILLITFAAGAVTAVLLLLPSSLKKSLEIKRLKGQLAVIPQKTAPDKTAGQTEPYVKP